MNIDELEAGPSLDRLVAELMGEDIAEPKPYSADLGLAWELAGKLTEENMQVELSIRRDHDDFGTTCHIAHVTRSPDLCFTMACDPRSPAAAICRAALKMRHEPMPDLLAALDDADEVNES